MSYQIVVQKLIRSFSHIKFEHVPRAHNKHVDALVTLDSKIVIPDEAIDVKIIKKTLQVTVVDLTSAISLMNKIGVVLSFRI